MTHRRICDVITHLANDEHIDFAIKAGIIRNAFVVSFQENVDDNPMSFEETRYCESHTGVHLFEANRRRFPNRPFHCPKSQNNMYIINNDMGVDCADCNNEHIKFFFECRVPVFNLAVEDIRLNSKLEVINEMVPGIVRKKAKTAIYP